MKVLVLGSGGQVGTELLRAAWAPGFEVRGLARPAFDLTLPDAVDGALDQHAAALVINAAAYTAVDKAETDEGTAFAVNAYGPEVLAAACARRGIPLIHISTDYVFPGTGSRPWREGDPIAPLNAYGRSKAAGEASVRLRQPRHVIVRTSWVYASHGQNFVRTMLRLAEEREEVRVVADQHGTPTAAADIAAALVAIAGRIGSHHGGSAADAPWGTYHFTAGGETTWHGTAEYIFGFLEQAGRRRPRLVAIGSSEYPTPARRPANSRLDCSRAEQTLGLERPSWQSGLDRVLRELVPARR